VAAISALLPNPVVDGLAEGLETPIQLMYLLTLLGFLAGGAWLVARQGKRGEGEQQAGSHWVCIAYDACQNAGLHHVR
jgi:hypothetical protein